MVLILLTASVAVDAIELVRDRQSVAQIVIAADADEADRFAAGELQKYLENMTGARLEIVSITSKAKGDEIRLGAAAKLKNWQGEEEVRLITPDEHTLLIAGEGPRGTVYAVYELLEALGVRFFSADCEKVPHCDSLSLRRLDYSYRPRFAYREFHGSPMNDDELMVKWRINGGAFKKALPERLGGARQMDIRHTLTLEFIRSSTYFDKHPEWFALGNSAGKRTAKQLCLSNHETVKKLLQEVTDKLRANPQLKFVSLGCNDNDHFCKCEKCTAAAVQYGTPAAATLLAINEIARTISTEFPQVRLVFQAYWSTERPPEQLELEPNVAVVLACLNRNFGVPASGNPRHNPYLAKWMRLAHRQVYIWDYWADFSNFLLPMPNIDCMGATMNTYAAFGVNGIFCQLPFGSVADFVDLRCYVWSRLAWNPELDSKQLIEEFCRAYYGAAGDTILTILKLRSEARDRQSWIMISPYTEATEHWLLPADVRRMRELFEQAMTRTTGSNVERQRVRRLRAGLLLVEIMRYKELAAAGNLMPDRNKLIDELADLGKEFHCGCYREWEDYDKLIARLRRSESLGPISTDGVPVFVPGKELTVDGGTASVAPDGSLIFRPSTTGIGYIPWQLDNGECISFTIPPKLAGNRSVAVKLKIRSTGLETPAAAYLIISKGGEYEYLRRPIPAPAVGETWQKVELGTFRLNSGCRISLVPGVLSPIEFIAIKGINLK